MLKLNLVHAFAVASFFVVCKSASIADNIEKCPIDNNECMSKLYTNVIKEIANNGIPEMGIPVSDPFIVKKVDVVALGLINATLTNGEAKGFGSCSITSFVAVPESRQYTLDLVCKHFSIGGNYDIIAAPALLALLGKVDIQGHGKGGVDAENIELKIEFSCGVQKLEDGELHFALDKEESSYTFKVLGGVKIEADHLMIGSQEIGELASKILTENKDLTVKFFGPIVMDRVFQILFREFSKFFEHVPINKITTTDFKPYFNN